VTAYAQLKSLGWEPGRVHASSEADSATSPADSQLSRHCPLAVPGGIEDYFHQVNAAARDEERHQIGERFGTRV
jgi:hypothetical protein